MVSRIFVFYNIFSMIFAIAIKRGLFEGFNIYNLQEQYVDDLNQVLPSYIIMLVSFSVGARVWQPISSRQNTKKWDGIHIDTMAAYGSITMLLFFNLLLMYGVFGDEFFVRDDYHSLMGESPGWMLLSKISLFCSIIFIYSVSSISSAERYSFIAFFIILSLNYSSRFSCAYILSMAAFDLFLFKRGGYLRWSIYVLVGLIVLTLASYFRSLDIQGLYYYFVFFDFWEFLEYFDFSIFYLFPFSVFVTICTMRVESLNYQDILVMMNPLPGFWAGWDSGMMARASIQSDVPFSTNGIVFSCGLLSVGFFYFFIGSFFYFIQTVSSLARDRGSVIWPMVFTCAGFYFVGLHSGWDLRSSMRIIYYTLFVAGCVRYSYLK